MTGYVVRKEGMVGIQIYQLRSKEVQLAQESTKNDFPESLSIIWLLSFRGD